MLNYCGNLGPHGSLLAQAGGLEPPRTVLETVMLPLHQAYMLPVFPGCQFLLNSDNGCGAPCGNRTRAFALEGQCSTVKLMARLERAAGIEPTLTIWTTVVLPLYDARMIPGGREAPFWRVALRMGVPSGSGATGGNRTPDPLLTRQPLCPLSYSSN